MRLAAAASHSSFGLCPDHPGRAVASDPLGGSEATDNQVRVGAGQLTATAVQAAATAFCWALPAP